MTAWIVILAIGLGSYALRAVMFVLVADRSVPARVDDALALVGPAAVAALIATMTLTNAGQVDALPAAELAAIVAGFLATRRTGNVMHAFTVGLPVLWVLTALGA